MSAKVIPRVGLQKVLRDADSILESPPGIVGSSRLPEQSRPFKHPYCGVVVLRNSYALLVHKPKIVLCFRRVLGGRSFVVAEGGWQVFWDASSKVVEVA